MLVTVKIAAPSLAVQKLFPLWVLLAAILNFGSCRRQSTSGSVKSKSDVSEMWEQPL